MTRTFRDLLLPSLLFVVPAVHANIVFIITPEHCASADGTVYTTVNGGVPPYTYSWGDGPTTQHRSNLAAGSYVLTVTDFVGTQQVNTAVVPNLPNWEWDPNSMFAQAIPSCMPGPEPNGFGFVFFGGDLTAAPGGPGPHQFDHACWDQQPFPTGSYPSDWGWFVGTGWGIVRAMCPLALAGQTYTVNYTDANGCPGYMEAVVPQPPQFYPITILDIQGSCSGGANGSILFSIPPEPDYIYGARPRLYNPDGQQNSNFSQYLSTNWTNGWTYDVPNLGPGTHLLVRRLSSDPDFWQFPCGDTTYFTIPDLGPTCGLISGTVAVDVNADCVLGFNDTRVPEMIIEFVPGPYYATTNAQGEYGINLPLGSYTVTQQTAVLDEHCLPAPITLNVSGNATFNLLDTATQALDIQLSMASGPARPGFELNYAIDLDNLTSATSTSNQVVMTFDPAVSYIAASPSPSSVVGNTITWNNTGALYYYQHRDISVRFQVLPNVGLIGTSLSASATLTQNPLDANIANNSATVVTTITGSYDPNDKTATTSSAWSRELYYLDVDEWIDYTIRYQNTGTDTAFTVVITDTLPATLDASTVVVGAGSHPFTWSLQGNGTLKFYMVNILLPDSNVNEAASHGFVSFRIRPRLPLLPGTMIGNTANIFFDFNDPVITDPSVLTAEFSTGIREPGQVRGHVHLVPNPATDRIRLQGGTAAALVRSWSVCSADGRAVLRGDGPFPADGIAVHALRNGPYILRLITSTGILNEQFIKAERP